jgi:putative ABC transport system permease protein
MGSWKIAVRSLARRPAFVVMVAGLLVLGVGANTALFSVVDTVLLSPLPYPDAGQLVSVYEASPSKNEKVSLVAPGRLEDWNRLSQTFTALSGAYSENVTDTGRGEPVRLAGVRVAPKYFAVFRTAPFEGRTFTPEEEVQGGRLAAVVSYGLWSRGWTVGKRLMVGGQGFTIVGAMPKNFTSAAIDVWLPAQTPAFLLQARDARFFSGVGRMKPGATVAQAQGDLERVQAALGEQFPKSDKGWSAIVRDLKESRVGNSRKALLLLFGAVGLLLLITVTNVASLFLAELGKRAREMAIRTSIGASRAQVVGEVVRESLLIAVLGAMGGWGIAAISLKLMTRMFSDVPRMNELQVDWRALLFAVGLSVVGSLLFGLLPAVRATSARHAANVFRAGRGIAGGRQSLQRVMVAGQIAVTMLLLGSSALLLRSFYALSHVERGFDTSHTMTFHVGAAWDEDRARVGRLQEQLIAGLRRLPGVEAAGMTNFLPASSATLRTSFKMDGADEGKVLVGTRTVSPGYLQALHAPLVKGKWCPDLSNERQPAAMAMVNRRFAESYGRGLDLIGRRVGGMEIVGVLGDMKEDALNAPAYPYVYACAMGGNWPDPEYVVRGAGAVPSAIRQLVKNVDPARVVFGMRTLEEAVDEDLERPRSNARMVTVFGVAAMLLAGVGLYGLITQMVNARRQEIGIRMALGAEPGRILRGVVGQAGWLAAVGVVLGLGLTVASQRVLKSFLFGVSGMDGWSLAAAVAVLGAVALFSAWVPARRAAGIDPVEAIRAE